METPASPKSVTHRIHEGLERIATALRADDWLSARAAGVNPTQFAIMSVLEGRSEGASVRMIADQLGVSQPSATDSISALERKGYVLRSASAADRRSVIVGLTTEGQAALAAAHSTRSVAEQAAGALDADQQEALLVSLVTMIRHLQESGNIPIQRMCVSCRHFRPYAHADAAQPHHCNFVDAAFGQQDLRIDCREHETADPSVRAATWSAFQQDHSHNPPGI
nr:MarR family transcriptional regulator [uncultured Devosia sp.]